MMPTIVSTPNIHYVYVYMDPRISGFWRSESFDITFPYEPFYIGKGKNKRLHEHVKEAPRSNRGYHQRIQEIQQSGNFPLYGKILNNMTERDALEAEVLLIWELGRKLVNSNSPLLNVHQGGTGGIDLFSQRLLQQTASYRQAISEAGKRHYAKNPERAVRHSLRMRGEQNPSFGNGFRISRDLNGNYVEIDQQKIKELRLQNFSIARIATALNTTEAVVAARLKWLGLGTKRVPRAYYKKEASV